MELDLPIKLFLSILFETKPKYDRHDGIWNWFSKFNSNNLVGYWVFRSSQTLPTNCCSISLTPQNHQRMLKFLLWPKMASIIKANIPHTIIKYTRKLADKFRHSPVACYIKYLCCFSLKRQFNMSNQKEKLLFQWRLIHWNRIFQVLLRFEYTFGYQAKKRGYTTPFMRWSDAIASPFR